MSKFVYKAIENEPFNNFGSTAKASKTSFSNTTNKNNNTTNAAGRVVATNNKTELENKINIEQTNKASSLANAVQIDQSTGYPPCPPGQSRVAWPADFSLEPLPNNSQNWSRMSGCGCWIDTGADITTLIGGVGAIGLFSRIAPGIDMVKVGVDSILNGKKAATNFGRFKESIKSIQKVIDGINNQISQLNIRYPKILPELEDIKSRIGIVNRTIVSINQQIILTRSKIFDLEKSTQSAIETFNTYVRNNHPELADNIHIDLETLPLEEIQYNTLARLRDSLYGFPDGIIAVNNSWVLYYQEEGIKIFEKQLQTEQTILNILTEKTTSLQDELLDIQSEIANLTQQKNTQSNLIQQTLADEASENARLINESTTEWNNLSSEQQIAKALTAIGIGVEVLAAVIYRRKRCFGQNVKLNEENCECECIDNEAYALCPATQNPVSQTILDLHLLPFTPESSELKNCIEKCSCGQAMYQFGGDSCACACLGDITFGTVVSGGGSADDTWKEGSGCDCLQPGILWSTRGKCVSQEVENRALAQGKTWDGSICDFACPDGDPDPCVGNATRPPNINYNGIMLEDECGECICDGSTFTCNEEEGYTKDTSLGVCDCVYAPVTAENIDLIP